MVGIFTLARKKAEPYVFVIVLESGCQQRIDHLVWIRSIQHGSSDDNVGAAVGHGLLGCGNA